jgi:ribonuclease III
MLSIRKSYHRFFGKERLFVGKVYRIAGLWPRNPEIYRLAFRHSSSVKDARNLPAECNERLEYLGDAVLGTVVADYLYNIYPLKTEGFLTEMRSRIVNRGTLNDFSVKLGIDQLMEHNPRQSFGNRSIYGNALEAFVGALYLDHGYNGAKQFIHSRIFANLVDLDEVELQDNNYKSRLMEYVQKNKLEVRFDLLEERNVGHSRSFTMAVRINGEVMGTGVDTKKKLAEQKAAEMAIQRLLAEPEAVEALPQS